MAFLTRGLTTVYDGEGGHTRPQFGIRSSSADATFHFPEPFMSKVFHKHKLHTGKDQSKWFISRLASRWYRALVINSYIWYFFNRGALGEGNSNSFDGEEASEDNDDEDGRGGQSNNGNGSACWNRRIRQLDQWVNGSNTRGSHRHKRDMPSLPLKELATELDLWWVHRAAWHTHVPFVFILAMVLRSWTVIALHVYVPNITDYISEESFYLYLGSPFHLLNSVTVFSEVMAMCWGVNLCTQHYLAVVNPKTSRQFRRINTLVNVVVFYQGEDEQGDASRLSHLLPNDPFLSILQTVPLHRTRRFARRLMGGLYIFNYVMAANVTFTTLAIAYFDFGTSAQVVHALLVWTPIWTFYTYNCAIYAYYVFFYFVTFIWLVRDALEQLAANLLTISYQGPSSAGSHWRTPSLAQLMIFHNEIVRLLHSYRGLWSRYSTALCVIFNGLVCFNSYLFLFTDSEYYIMTVYNVTSLTAFNIFFFGNFSAARLAMVHLRLQGPLFSMLVRDRTTRQCSELKALGIIATGENVGIEYVNHVLITMTALNSVISNLFMCFALFIRLCQATKSQS